MFAPRPYGRFSENAELSVEDAAAVELLARRLTNQKELSGLDNLKLVRDLPSGRQAVAVDMGGVFRIMILEPHELPQFQFEGIAESYIPMLFSGVITKHQVREGEGVGIKLTEQARRRIANYIADNLPPKDVALQRFVIEYGDAFSYFAPKEPGVFTWTQYGKQRPTWYSGAMSEVMQVVGGYGRQIMAELPEDDVERARMIVPERFMAPIRQQINKVRLPAYTGFPNEEGQFVCQYMHGMTNAVSFDSAGSPWLLRINSAGVHAMPLPIIPATATPAFREYIEDAGDDEVLALLDRFGAMPSGEGFPADETDFEAWRRAGVIIKVCTTSDFYEHNAFYSACGWSLNSRGNEGYNTCYDYRGDGLMESYGYKMKLTLGAAPGQGRLAQSWDVTDPIRTQQLNAYLGALYAELGANEARELAIKYKIRRQTVDQILARNGANIASEVDYWDNLEVTPIATHSGSVTRVASGPIYWGNPNPLSSGRLKFPETTGKGCESFVLFSPDYEGGPVRCDTVVFGCYVDDGLEVVKYFIDERKFNKDEESTYEDCMIVGSWEKTVSTGATGLMGNFYTSAFDDRAETTPLVTHTKIVGSDLGYGEPAYSTPPTFFKVGTLGRARFYAHKTTVNTTGGFGLDCAACIPVFARDCILYAYSEATSGKSETVSADKHGMADPTSYQLWTYDAIWHYLGSTQSGDLGEPRPKDGSPVFVDSMLYNPNQCSDFADSGNWFGLPDGAFINVSSVCAPYTSGPNHPAGGVTIGGREPGFQPYSTSKSTPAESAGRVNISFSSVGSVRAHNNGPESWYFAFSPVDDMYFYRDAIRVTMGDISYASYYEKDANDLRRHWGYSTLADNKSAHHFIGVINE